MSSARVVQVIGFVAALGLILADAAAAQAGSSGGGGGAVTGGTLWLAALFGAIGGVVYELIVLQGNIEMPHRADPDELPEAGYALAKKARFLFDLGIVARFLIGAAAAVVVLWALPPTTRTQVLAASLVAGSAGTAVFRSMQDRLLASLNAEKTETVRRVVEDMLESTERGPAGRRDLTAETDPAELHDRLTEIRGQLRALVTVAGPRDEA